MSRITALLLCLLAGCGGGDDSRHAARIWFTTDDASLRAATRVLETSPRPVLVLRALLAGPTPAEQNRGVRTDLPDGVELRSVSLRGGIVRVELQSPQLEPYEPNATTFALRLAQLVYTLTDLPRVQRVQLAVNGKPWGFGRHDGSLVRTYTRETAPYVCEGHIWVGTPPSRCRAP